MMVRGYSNQNVDEAYVLQEGVAYPSPVQIINANLFALYVLNMLRSQLSNQNYVFNE